MNSRQKHVYLPAALSAGSFITLLLIVLLSNPIRNISYAVIFFGALVMFFISFGYLVFFLQNGTVRPRTRYRLVVISLLLVTLLMLRSTQSLGSGDAVVLLIISILMLFYIGRRIY